MPFGRFERTAAAAPMGEINVTPLVDVMLVLVVIFILTAPLLASSIVLELPRGVSGEAAAESGGTVSVAIDRDSKLFLHDQPVDRATLERAFAATGRATPTAEVRLRADRAVPYGRVVEVMDAARRGGLYRIGFMTEPEPAGPSSPVANAPSVPDGPVLGSSRAPAR